MRISATAFLTGLVMAPFAEAQSPLSAIDWLSDSVSTPAAAQLLPGSGLGPVPVGEPPVSGGVLSDTITVTPLDQVSADAVGLLPVSVTGLPRELWAGSSGRDIAGRLGRLNSHLLPAMQDLVYTLLLAELDPPGDSNGSEVLFLARIDALLALGAVEQAQALLERAGPRAPERFRRWFDTTLLTGAEDEACETLRTAPELAPTYPARIFCLARGGDWNAAALTLETGQALGTLTLAEDALLAQFLDPELVEVAAPFAPPARPSPLIFRIYEAIGEPLPTTRLPLAFAYADLRPISGWKAQVEAAERLARTGALDGNRFIGLYTERRPAASGGVWDRVAAVQRLDRALAEDDAAAVSAALPGAWQVMQRLELETVFAELYADALLDLPLDGTARELILRIALLSPGYEAAALDWRPETAETRFLKGLARGDVSGLPATSPEMEAIAEGFAASGAPLRLQSLLDNDRLGEAILRAIQLMSEGAKGDLDGLSDALALFRAVGLEDVARRAALQVLLLDRRG